MHVRRSMTQNQHAYIALCLLCFQGCSGNPGNGNIEIGVQAEFVNEVSNGLYLSYRDIVVDRETPIVVYFGQNSREFLIVTHNENGNGEKGTLYLRKYNQRAEQYAVPADVLSEIMEALDSICAQSDIGRSWFCGRTYSIKYLGKDGRTYETNIGDEANKDNAPQCLDVFKAMDAVANKILSLENN